MPGDLSSARLRDIRRFYEILHDQELRFGGTRTLADAHGRMVWPMRGVYFFFEPHEIRTTSGDGMRVVRVGTHALSENSNTTLWDRLRAHRGTLQGSKPAGGNHRRSVFRLHVGIALIARDNWPLQIANMWGVRGEATKEVQAREYPLEQAVSQYIRNMPFL